MKNLLLISTLLILITSCKATLTTIGFDDNKEYFSPESIMVHDGKQDPFIMMGPFKLERFLEIKDAYKDCKWLIHKNNVHIYCKSNAPKKEHKPHVFKQRGFGNINHNAPGHVCDETCHE